MRSLFNRVHLIWTYRIFLKITWQGLLTSWGDQVWEVYPARATPQNTQFWKKKGEIPQDMRDANIVTLYKTKGDRSDCNNYLWISLLSIVGNIHWADYKCCFPHDEFSRPWITYTLWYVRSIQKKMIAKLCSGLRSYGPLKYVTTPKIVIFVY